MEKFIRTESLIGKENIEKLYKSKVIIFGIGGVGTFVVEALARSGVGSFILVDSEKIDESNINRQIHSLVSTVGQYKVDAMRDRILAINPDAKVEALKEFYLPESDYEIPEDVDYIVDSLDTITTKLQLVEEAKEKNIKIITALGAGNKMNPAMLEVADIYKTSICPLARVMRRELKKRRIKKLKVVYSKEMPKKPEIEIVSSKRSTPASIAFVPSTMGLIIASEVVKDLIEWNK